MISAKRFRLTHLTFKNTEEYAKRDLPAWLQYRENKELRKRIFALGVNESLQTANYQITRIA